MQHGLVNCNEFYTANYWDEILSKELMTKTSALHNYSERVRILRDLGRVYWNAKEQVRRGGRDSALMFIEFYRCLFSALNYVPEWVIRKSIEDGALFSVFVSAGDVKQRCEAWIITETDTEEFEGIPFWGLEVESEDKIDKRTISEILDEEFLNSDPPLRWALVCTPEALFLTERSKWPSGRYITIDWDTVFSQRGAEVYEEILGLCAQEHLGPASGASVHDEWNDSSHRHAFSVTTALREAVRQSIEDLVNEMVYFRRLSKKKFMPDGEPESFARELTRDALFYVYRIIFLMYVEAQGDDADTLPIKSEIYRSGYSIEKLVEICINDLDESSPEFSGNFFHESLNKIFSLVWNGYAPKIERPGLGLDEGVQWSRTGFFVKGLKADLFDPNQIKHLTGVNFRNCILHGIIKRLAFAKGIGRKAQMGRVSYANLGINQLGAVYEGLLSYTGYFAKEPLVALKATGMEQAEIDRGKAGDSIYLCPKGIAEFSRGRGKHKLTEDNFVRVSVEDDRIVEYPRGSFIYRLAGRDRQKLASYYTPESLTTLTVKYALKVLFEKKNSPEELLSLKILEPAMGSGAFLGEAVKQIADYIVDLEVKRDPKGLATPDLRRRRTNEIKYHLVSKCVFGVDLNPTAIELAKFSLWLGCIGAGKAPPDFSGRLKLGNSLIGARFEKNSAGIYPWLSLDEGMLNYGNKLRDYAPEDFVKVKAFRTALLPSELRADIQLVQSIQSKAESLFALVPEPEAYVRLKAACDLWCTIFFLRGEDLSVMPNSHEKILEMQLKLLDGKSLDERVHRIVERVVESERFFHWELEFVDQFRSGGFDLILANPPWVAVGWQDSLYVSDLNPIPAALELNAADTRTFVQAQSDIKIKHYLANEYVRVEGYTQMLNVPFYADIRGSQKNTYKAFDVLMLRILTSHGSVGVIQEDGVLDDEDGTALRSLLYRRYRYHFQFQNELDLFAEVHHAKRYSINVFGSLRGSPRFDHIGNLFSPGTVEACFTHVAKYDAIPLIKDPEGSWETRGHNSRIVNINHKSIEAFGRFLNQEESIAPAFLNLHSSELLGFVDKIGDCKTTLGDLAGEGTFVGSPMFHETNAQDEGWIKKSPGRAGSIDRVVLSGPNIGPGNPFAKECRGSYRVNSDYDQIDLADMPADFIPRTVYQFVGDIKKLDDHFPELRGNPYRKYFRVLTRDMINPANERCCFSAIIPPGTTHINTLVSIAFYDEKMAVLSAGITASLVADSILRLRGAGHFYSGNFATFPAGKIRKFDKSICRRTLGLNCLSQGYDSLWNACKDFQCIEDRLLHGSAMGDLSKPWSKSSAIRQPIDRVQALLEIDALVALSFELKETELAQIYEVLFPVLNKYDREAGFDRKSKLIQAHKYFADRGW